MLPFSNLLAALADVPDPRRAQGKRYPLPHLLLFTVLALLSGAKSYRGVITFLEQRRQHLNHHFAVALKRAPAVNTLRTVLQSLPAGALEGAFRRHAEALLTAAQLADLVWETMRLVEDRHYISARNWVEETIRPSLSQLADSHRAHLLQIAAARLHHPPPLCGRRGSSLDRRSRRRWPIRADRSADRGYR